MLIMYDKKKMSGWPPARDPEKEVGGNVQGLVGHTACLPVSGQVAVHAIRGSDFCIMFFFHSLLFPPKVWEAEKDPAHRGHGVEAQEDDQLLQTGDGKVLQMTKKWGLTTFTGSPSFLRDNRDYPLSQGWSSFVVLDFCSAQNSCF